MELNRSRGFFTCALLFWVVFSGCSSTGNLVGDWTDTSSMEQYGNQVYATLVKLRKYIGESKKVILKDFGNPHEVDKSGGSKAVYYQQERVEFDEEWEYCYSQGVFMINQEKGCKFFFFKDDVVVSVDAI